LAQPEYFIRGYRIEAATRDAADIWRPLAEQLSNYALNVDTQTDSTWGVLSAQGEPLPRLGRFVRLTLVRQDRSNWVAIGDMEVYGTGLVEQGRLVQEFSAPAPVNVGRIRWQSQVPEDAALALQFRGSAEEGHWVDWIEMDSSVRDGELFHGQEPVSALQFRATLSSASAFVTPQLQQVEIEYDPVLVAHDVRGWVEPDTAVKAVRSRLTYHATVEVQAGDHGVDLLRLRGLPLDVAAVRVDGAPLFLDVGLESGYRWSVDPASGETLIELAPTETLTGLRRVEVDVAGFFLRTATTIELAVGSGAQSRRDGFINWQNGRPADGSTWVVSATGAPPDLIGDLEVTPRPFSPFASEAATFRFVVGNLQGAAEITVELHTLLGQRVRRLVQSGDARPYSFAWDGRNDAGDVVDPGLYLFEVRVEAGNHSASRRGALAVAY
jgi:flagellar hook capping protein FlgD